jgi:hypothetical protein
VLVTVTVEYVGDHVAVSVTVTVEYVGDHVAVLVTVLVTVAVYDTDTETVAVVVEVGVVKDVNEGQVASAVTVFTEVTVAVAVAVVPVRVTVEISPTERVAAPWPQPGVSSLSSPQVLGEPGPTPPNPKLLALMHFPKPKDAKPWLNVSPNRDAR